jgi:hypothetical protein
MQAFTHSPQPEQFSGYKSVALNPESGAMALDGQTSKQVGVSHFSIQSFIPIHLPESIATFLFMVFSFT